MEAVSDLSVGELNLSICILAGIIFHRLNSAPLSLIYRKVSISTHGEETLDSVDHPTILVPGILTKAILGKNLDGGEVFIVLWYLYRHNNKTHGISEIVWSAQDFRRHIHFKTPDDGMYSGDELKMPPEVTVAEWCDEFEEECDGKYMVGDYLPNGCEIAIRRGSRLSGERHAY